MDETPNISNVYLRQLLEQRGWYRRWYSQVMADILLPHVNRLAQPEKNVVLNRYKEDEVHMLSLYMVKEFLRTVCLPSTSKIFEAEAGLVGMDHDYHASILEHFSLLRPTTTQEVNPPLLSQALHIWKVESGENHTCDSHDDSHHEGDHHDDHHESRQERSEKEPSEVQVALSRLLQQESSSDSTSSTCAPLGDTVTHISNRTGGHHSRLMREPRGNGSVSFKASDTSAKTIDSTTTQGLTSTPKNGRRSRPASCRSCN